MTEGDYRVLVGVNAPDVLTGQAQPQGDKVLEAPIEVQTGLKIFRISAVNSQDENFTVLGSLRMDWTDPDLAFSPDSCNCSVKLYTDKEFDRFLADVGSRWPAFTFFNQLGNRWIQSRAAAIWPDGRARYAENFNTTFQADFDFRQYPFDTQTFPIYLDLLYPTSTYTMVELPGYSEIDPAHGEDEFIISDFTTAASTVTPSAANDPVSRMTFSFNAPRHLNYYSAPGLSSDHPDHPDLLVHLLPARLHPADRSRGRQYPAVHRVQLQPGRRLSATRLRHLPRRDHGRDICGERSGAALQRVHEATGESREGRTVERIDNVLDWVYPLLYAALIGVVILLFL